MSPEFIDIIVLTLHKIFGYNATPNILGFFLL